MKGDDFFDAQVGVSSIMGWNIGDCVVEVLLDLQQRKALRQMKGRFLRLGRILRGSLFDNNDISSLEIPELTFNTDEFLKVHNEALALRRYGAFFLDYLYTMEIEPEKDPESVNESQVEGLEVVGEIRLVKEFVFQKDDCGSNTFTTLYKYDA
ncbi:Vacuolar protein sorting-associated protein 13B [Desmophyllum pertusum]|uniref:Vacuolar protein sorting-associated protein 13B n=1 Tax=Desmophyllum pertusum TaxID=174260 RepID=A0A9W9YDD6_9CNID|nr:Vacuolar protein sorting-associated protein 13B [Desmophyllum pertusum]